MKSIKICLFLALQKYLISEISYGVAYSPILFPLIVVLLKSPSNKKDYHGVKSLSNILFICI